jgi:hypothetical protein
MKMDGLPEPLARILAEEAPAGDYITPVVARHTINSCAVEAPAVLAAWLQENAARFLAADLAKELVRHAWTALPTARIIAS